MSTVVVGTTPDWRIRFARFARNGFAPNAEYAIKLADETNKIVRWRLKEVYRFAMPIGNLWKPAAGADVTVGRFAFHSSPYAKNMFVWIWGAQAVSTGAVNPRVRVRIETGAPTTVGDAEVSTGYVSTTVSDVPANFRVRQRSVIDTSTGLIATIPADTDLYGTVDELEGGIMVACSVYEMALDPTTDNGYASNNFGVHSPIFDEDRSDIVTALRNMWKHGAAHLINWSRDGGTSRTNSTTTARNLIDDTSTAVSTSTPGWTLDLSNCSTIRRASTGVPVTWKVYATRTVSNGTVTLKDSGGAAVLTISVTGGAGWYSTTGNLPASSAKYDVHYAAGVGGTLQVDSFSLYQYET